MRSTFKVLFFLKRDKKKANGMIPLYCRITVDGQEARFGMKCDVNPQYWDVKASKASGRTAEATTINNLIDTTKSAIYRIYRETQERENYVTAEKIKNIFLGIEQKQQTLLELFDYHNRERKSMIGININQVGYNNYCITRQQVADFLLYKYNLHDISIKEIDHQFLCDFESYLLLKHGYVRNSLLNILKRLRHIFLLAVNKGWIYKNPFKEYNLQWEKVDRGYLTQEEIDRLIDCQFKRKTLEKARDIFLFCSFSGLSYSDVKHLTYDNIQPSIDGKLWIKGFRKKTKTEYNIPLLNIPKMILEKYRGTTKNNLVLPVNHSSNYNKHLKKVATACGITKNMSSHLARHTFATLTLTKGVSIESVSKMLGHTNISTTQIYAKVTDKKVGNEMKMFAQNVKNLDVKLQLTTTQEEVKIEDVYKTLKIPFGKATDIFWEHLIQKVWLNWSNTDRQAFVAELENMENKPTTLRDFYVEFIDFFLDSIKCDNFYNHPESVDINTEIQLAVNF